MKKHAISFIAGFLTAAISFTVYAEIFKKEVPAQSITIPAEGAAGAIASDEELLQKCPNFCENRPDRLEAPQFAKDLPLELKNDFSGGVGLRWQPVKNAVKYRAIVFDRSGKERQLSLTTKNNRLFFPNLPKAALGESIHLSVAVAAIDKNETEGRMSEKRKLVITGTVPLVRAPKVKMIKVED